MTKTIFDSPWFALERPVFKKLAAVHDETLTVLLFIAAIGIVFVALQPGRTILKAGVLVYILLP